MNTIRIVECCELPNAPQTDAVYRLLPKDPDVLYYRERVDRNIGWITEDEQATLRRTVVGIAGCGGMGGRLAETFLRLGVGEIRIADSETFDASNINRQFAAMRGTVGCSKAVETARLLRTITDDATIVVYPQGIAEEIVGDFVRGCDVICDEIEFWCVGSRILLHERARDSGVPVFVANTIGFGSHVFLFTPTSGTMEECLVMGSQEAMILERAIGNRSATRDDLVRVMERVTRSLFPEWPEYCAPSSLFRNRSITEKRLVDECRGAIIATNPPFASGFAADRVLLHLLKRSATPRDVTNIPEMPGYLYLDAALMQAKVVKGKWW